MLEAEVLESELSLEEAVLLRRLERELLEGAVQQTWLWEQVPTVCVGVHSKKKTQEEPAGHPALVALERRELRRELSEEREEIGVLEAEVLEVEILERELTLEEAVLLRRLERALLEGAVQQTWLWEQVPTVCVGVHSKKKTQEEPVGQAELAALERRELRRELAEDCEEIEEAGVEERELARLEISELSLEDSALLRRLERALLEGIWQQTSDCEQLPTV